MRPLIAIPPELAEHTVESLYIEHQVRRPWVYWLVLFASIIALVSLPFIKVDVTIRASGVVRPATERTNLKTPMGGHIARLYVKDNDYVVVGQRLLEFETASIEIQVARNKVLQEETSQLIHDLSLLVGLKEGGPSLESRLKESQGPDFLSYAIAQEYYQLQSQLLVQKIALENARANYGRLKQLGQIVSERELEIAEFSVQSAEAQYNLIIQQTLNTWKTRLLTKSTEYDNLLVAASQLEESLCHTVICAPVAGTLEGFFGLMTDAYVSANQIIGNISPDDKLVIEIGISPKDVGLVRLNQPARLQIDAYPYTQWGLLDATVFQIAEDASSSGQNLQYRVLLVPRKTTLQLSNGVTGSLKKGMTANARLIVTQRTLFQMLYEDVSSWFSPYEQTST